MDVHGAVTSPRTRIAFLVGALLVYVGLIGYGAVTGDSAAFALAQVHIGLVLVVAVGFGMAIQQVRSNLLTLSAVGYFLAGLAIGYSGLAALSVVPAYDVLAPAGDVALFVALGAYLYQRHRTAGSGLTPEAEPDDADESA